MSRTAHGALLFLILIAATALRTVNAGQSGLWLDEALTLAIAHWPVERLLFTPVDPTGGLYYVLAKASISDVADAATVRSLSILFGVATVGAIYWLGRTIAGQRAGLIAAAITAVSAPLVDYSQEARCYSLLTFLVVLSATGLAQWLRALAAGDKGRGGLALFALAGTAAFYTHLTALFWLGPAILAGWFYTRRSGDGLAQRRFAVAALAIWIASLPEAYRMLAYHQIAGALNFLSQSTPGQFLAWTGELLLPTGLWKLPETTPGTPTILGLFALIAILAALALRSHERLRTWSADRAGGAVIVIILVTVPLTVWLFGFVVTPIFMVRTILLGAIGFALLMGVIASIDRLGMAVASLFMVASTASLAMGGTTRPKEAWKPLAATLEARMQPGDAIIVCPEWHAPAIVHALKQTSERPIYLVFDNHVASIRRQSFKAGWAEVYRGVIYDFDFGSWPGKSKPPIAAMQATPARFWIVRSACGERSARLARWLGPGVERPVWNSPQTSYHLGIDLVQFEGAAMPRPVVPAAAR